MAFKDPGKTDLSLKMDFLDVRKSILSLQTTILDEKGVN